MEADTNSKPTKDANDKDALKLKIRLSKPNSSTGITRTESSGGSDTDGSGGPDKPLKIIIKRSDLGNSSTSITHTLSSSQIGLTGSPRQLPLASFPKVNTTNFPSFQRAISTTPDQLENWNEKELASLREDLDAIRRSIKDFSNSLQTQLEVLENWSKDKSQAITLTGAKPPGTPALEKRNSVAIPKSAEPKPKRQKRKKDESSDDDFDDEGNESDEDEMVDIEESTGDIDANGDDKGAVNRSATKLGALVKRRQGRPGKPKAATPSTNRVNTRVKDRKRGDPADIYEEYSDEDELPKQKGGKNNFWADMDPFFAPFTEEDLKYCTPVNFDPDDPAFVIPPLGRYYKEGQAEEEREEEEARLRAQQEAQDDSEKGPCLGELTQRLLAALIEEKIVPVSAVATAPTSLTKPFTRLDSVDDVSKSKDQPDFVVPFLTPPTYDYSQDAISSLEERLRLELKSIGILDDDDLDNLSREDDEVCSEIRRLQSQLRDLIGVSNTMRSKLHNVVQVTMVTEEEKRKERQAIEVFEQNYLKNKRKRKKNT